MQDDPLLHNLGALLAAGDPLSEAYGRHSSSSSSVKHSREHTLPSHAERRNSSSSGDVAPMEEDRPAAAAPVSGGVGCSDAAAAAGEDKPAVGSEDAGCTAALADGDGEQQQQQGPGRLLGGRENRWACR